MLDLFVTVLGSGRLRPASGTWGTLASLPLAWAVIVLFGWQGFLLATVAVTLAGLWAVARYLDGAASPDPSEVVIDELSGMWIALWPVAVMAGLSGEAVLRHWPAWVAAFVLFRAFDILKPGPVGWADRQHGAFGVMADDVIAGALAALCVVVLARLALFLGVA